MKTRTVFFISDSTAITTETLGHSLLIQFKDIHFEYITIPYIHSVEKAKQVLQKINETSLTKKNKPLVFSTLVDPEVRQTISSNCNCFFMDCFDMFMPPLEQELKTKYTKDIGKSHGVSNHKTYEDRINAINFTLDTDDGANTKHYNIADLIIVGVSRSGKTPTSLYMALQFGIYAANYPITEEEIRYTNLPKALISHRHKLFGLIISPQKLHTIREQRQPQSRYASLKQCQYEIKQTEQIFKQENISYLETTAFSIEEISTKIIETIGIKRYRI